ncbi:MAG: PQQ-binding-like beta-propeller repeat protein [bacterium]
MKRTNILIFAAAGLGAVALMMAVSGVGFKRSRSETEVSGKPRVVVNRAAVLTRVNPATASDWPQWRGPNRDGISSQTGILTSWPETGLEILWRARSGDGYSGISVVDGRLYTMYGIEADEFIVCLDAKQGKEQWRYRLDSKFTNQFGHGPRSTPSIDGGLVYGLGAKGKLVALDAGTGAVVWKHDLRKEYGGRIPTWGVATSPLVYGDLLLVDVGGRQDYGVVAFNKKNGKLVWKTRTEIPGYSAPIAVTVGGIEQILCFTGNSLISVNPDNGALYWRYAWVTSYDVNAATPIFIAPDKVFVSSGYNVGGAVLRMKTQDGKVAVEEVWKSRIMRNHFSTSLFVDGHLYGFDEGTLRCIDALTQEKKWAKRGFGKGSLLYADGHLIVLSERGKLVLVEARPEEYIERASAQVLKGRCWTVPTLVNGRLYLRNQREILCLNFAG